MKIQFAVAVVNVFVVVNTNLHIKRFSMGDVVRIVPDFEITIAISIVVTQIIVVARILVPKFDGHIVKWLRLGPIGPVVKDQSASRAMRQIGRFRNRGSM